MSSSQLGEFVGVDGVYYQAIKVEGDRALLLHMNATGPGPINVGLGGSVLLAPGMYWESLSRCQRFGKLDKGGRSNG